MRLDEDGDDIEWSLKEDTADYKKFEISEDGVLSFESPPDFEAKADTGGEFVGDNVYNSNGGRQQGRLH